MEKFLLQNTLGDFKLPQLPLQRTDTEKILEKSRMTKMSYLDGEKQNKGNKYIRQQTFLKIGMRCIDHIFQCSRSSISARFQN